MPRTRLAPLTALLLAALFLAGCGGGGGEPTVTQTLHDELQAELDAALADLETEREAREDEAAARTTAETEVTRLEGAIGDADDLADVGGSLYAQLNAATANVTQLTDQLEAATGNIQSLTAQIGDADDEDSLQGMLAAEKAEVTRLEMLIGVATDAAKADGSLHAQLNAANAEVTRLEGVIGVATDAAKADGSLHAQLNAAKARVTSLETLIGDAVTPTADSLRGQLAAAKTEATKLKAQIGSATDATSLQGKLTTAEAEVTQLTNALTTSQAEVTRLTTALATAQATATTATQQATDATQEADRRVEQAEQQGNVSLRVTPMLMAMDGAALRAATVRYMPRMSLVFKPIGDYAAGTAAPTVPGGWRSASFTRVTGGGTETAYLYTNIGSPSGKHFWKVHGQNVSTAVDSGPSAWNLTLAKPTAFGTAGTVRSLYPDGNDADSNPDDKVGRVTRGGTYNGYSGTFSCVGTSDTGCNMAAGTDNALTDETGVWTFKASATAGGTPTQDPEFLYFGIWVSEPTLATAVHGFNWIANGDATDITLFNELEGTATFNGGAVGRYVLRNQVGQDDRIGTFTATASFTADFDKGPDGIDNGNSIEGRITNFRDGGAALAGWNVYLGNNPTMAFALTAAGVTSGVATARIGGVIATGDWAATLHGSDNPGHTVFGPGANDVRCPVSGGCPSADVAGVAGRFDAFSNTDAPASSDAAIAGAFAAK